MGGKTSHALPESGDTKRSHQAPERLLPTPNIQVATLETSAAWRDSFGECRHAIVAALAINGVPCTFRSTLIKFLWREQVVPDRCPLHTLVTRTLATVYRFEADVRPGTTSAADALPVVNELSVDLAAAAASVLRHVSQYEDLRVTLRQHRRTCFAHARYQMAQLCEAQLVCLGLHVDVASEHKLRISLPCALKRSDVRRHPHAIGTRKAIEDDIVRHLWSDHADYLPEHERSSTADDPYYEKWAHLYRYAPADLKPLVGLQLLRDLCPGLSAPSPDQTCSAQTQRPEDNIAGSKDSICADEMESHQRNRKRDLCRSKHQSRMTDIHERRVEYYREIQETAHYSRTRVERKAKWVNVCAFRLQPAQPRCVEMLRTSSLAALQGLDACVGMNIDLRGASLRALQEFWTTTIPVLLYRGVSIVFQYNTAILTTIAPLTGTRSYCRWVFDDVPPSAEVVAFQHATAMSKSPSPYVKIPHPHKKTPFLANLLDGAADGCYVVCATYWNAVFALLKQHITVEGVNDTIVRAYLGIYVILDNDARLEPAFISATSLSPTL